MTSVCTCSHSIDVHGVAASGGRCRVCTCDCFRGAKRIPRSCRYPLRNKFNSPSDCYDHALVLGGIDADMRALMSNDQDKEAS